MYLDPRKPQTWNGQIRDVIAELPTFTSQQIPHPLYHGTASNQFAHFDFERSCQTVWLTPNLAKAQHMATDFQQAGRGPAAYAVECTVASGEFKVFASEAAIFQLGKLFQPGGNRVETLTNAALAVQAAGFIGMVDCYGRPEQPADQHSYGIVVPSALQIMRFI